MTVIGTITDAKGNTYTVDLLSASKSTDGLMCYDLRCLEDGIRVYIECKQGLTLNERLKLVKQAYISKVDELAKEIVQPVDVPMSKIARVRAYLESLGE